MKATKILLAALMVAGSCSFAMAQGGGGSGSSGGGAGTEGPRPPGPKAAADPVITRRGDAMIPRPGVTMYGAMEYGQGNGYGMNNGAMMRKKRRSM